MTRTVLSVGYPFAPVSEDAVGGAEQVVSMLDRELTSAVRGTLVPVPQGGERIDDAVRERTYESVRRAIAATLERKRWT